MHLLDLIRLAPITIRALVTPFKNPSLGKFTLICFDGGGWWWWWWGEEGGGGREEGVKGGCCGGGGWWWCGLTGQGGWGGGGGHPPRPERLPTTFLRTLKQMLRRAKEFSAENENLLFLITEFRPRFRRRRLRQGGVSSAQDTGGHVGWPKGLQPWRHGWDFMNEAVLPSSFVSCHRAFAFRRPYMSSWKLCCPASSERENTPVA